MINVGTKIIIIGSNRATIGKISVRQLDRHFFRDKGMTYKIYPDGFTRIRNFDKDGVEMESDEGYAFPENGTVPYHPRHVDFSDRRIAADIRTGQLLNDGWLKKKQWSTAASSLKPYAGLIMLGMLLIYAFGAQFLIG